MLGTALTDTGLLCHCACLVPDILDLFSCFKEAGCICSPYFTVLSGNPLTRWTVSGVSVGNNLFPSLAGLRNVYRMSQPGNVWPSLKKVGNIAV